MALNYLQQTARSGDGVFKGVSCPTREDFQCLSFSWIAILGVSEVVYRVLISFLWEILICFYHSLVG
jgi:hypothetical protein